MNKKTIAPPQSDMETRATSSHAQELRLWLRMLATTHLVEAEIRSRLRSQFNITLPRFDLMSQLERAPDGMKMGELSKRMMVTGGNVTGITDQLVAEGLVVREDNPNDRRAYNVKLTPVGRKTFMRMAEAHEVWIVELLGDLSDKEREQFHGLLAKLKAHVASCSGARKSKNP